LDHQSVFIS